MRKLEIDNTLYLVPGKWNELSKKDLLKWCEIASKPVGQQYKRILLLKYFTGLSLKKLNELPTETIPELAGIFDFLFNECHLAINHFPKVAGMDGPEPGLANFTFEQFLGQSEPYAYKFNATGDAEALDELINIMYNYNGAEANKKKLHKLDDNTKLAIYYFYHGSSNFIKIKFKAVFTKDTEKNTKPDGLEFVRLVNSLNLGDVSKNMQIKENNLYEALDYLNKLINKSNGFE